MCIAESDPSFQAVVRISIDNAATNGHYDIYSAKSSDSSRTPSNSDPVAEDVGSDNGTTTAQPNISSAESAYTMIAPIQVGSQLNTSAPCFALGGNSIFQIICSNNPQSTNSVNIPISSSGAKFNNDLLAFMSSQNSTRLFTVTTKLEGGEYDFSKANQASDNRSDPTTATFLSYKDSSNSQDHINEGVKKSNDKFVVISNNSTKLSALWIPSNYNGTFVHVIEVKYM